MLVDHFFTYLPIVLSIYHFHGFTRRNFYHSNQSLRIVLCFVISNLLKFYFKAERQMNIKTNYGVFRRFLDKIIYCFTSNYAFPSTHSLFYTQYFIYNMSILTFAIALFGIISRIIYNHHTIDQVFFGFALALLLEYVLLYRFRTKKRKNIISPDWIRFKMKQNKFFCREMLKSAKFMAE